MKIILRGLLAITALIVLLIGGAAIMLESPVRTLETFAIRHADKLPLERIGEHLFDQHCASCHDNPAMLAPTREALSGFAKESLLVAMEFGKMQPMAAHLSKQERGLIAIYLAGTAQNDYDWVAQNTCTEVDTAVPTEFVANWGLGTHNRRFVAAEHAGITAANVGDLRLAWALAFPKVTDMRSQPAIIGNTLYLGDRAGQLYAIDRLSGCIRAHTKVFSGIRSAITIATLNNGKKRLIFADSLATVFAVDPANLEIDWQQPARLFDTTIITGSISYHNDRLYVPLSSYEVAVSGSPSHICCQSHGGVMALDANSGRELWQWHATPAATLQGQNSVGQDQYGPSGAAVWTTPAIDAKRNRIYFGTAENLTHPATSTSDAIIALDMDTGENVWQFQAIVDDVWNSACLNGGANCPQNPGGDFDFGASVILAQMPNGQDVLLAGQKSGEVFALNPDANGGQEKVLWRQRVSDGTTNGGIHWGMALSGTTLIVPVSDPEREREGYTPRPGLYALDMRDGSVLWQQPVQRDCELAASNRPLIGLENLRAEKTPSLAEMYQCSFFYGLSAAATATAELAISAGLDGVVRAYRISDGFVLWQTRTAEPFVTTNGIAGHGGAIDVAGQLLASGWLYAQSGYSMFGQLPGNVLLAYTVEPATEGDK